MRYLTLSEVLELYRRLMDATGGQAGIRDLGLLESAIAQPRASFEGREFYSSLNQKAAALGHALIANHPFIDGNKRIGHAAMESFLMLNGWEITASVDEQERTILSVADGSTGRESLSVWLDAHVQTFDDVGS